MKPNRYVVVPLSFFFLSTPFLRTFLETLKVKVSTISHVFFFFINIVKYSYFTLKTFMSPTLFNTSEQCFEWHCPTYRKMWIFTQKNCFQMLGIFAVTLQKYHINKDSNYTILIYLFFFFTKTRQHINMILFLYQDITKKNLKWVSLSKYSVILKMHTLLSFRASFYHMLPWGNAKSGLIKSELRIQLRKCVGFNLLDNSVHVSSL